MYFSKSKYCDFCQCGKMSWLKKNKPEELVIDESTKARFAAGNEVGDLAMGYFGDYVEVTAHKEDGKLDLAKMIENTKIELGKNTSVICEASFSLNGLYCAVDILRRDGEGWRIYEVKSSTHEKDVNILDIAYQKYVLENSGINVTGTYLMLIDNTYIFEKTLDIHKLFKVIDVSEKVAEKLPEVEGNLKRAEEILAEKNEPNIEIGAHCFNPYECGFWNYCTRNIPKPNVFDLRGMRKTTMFDFYNRGAVTFGALENESSVKNPINIMQIAHYLHEREPFVDKENLREFLNGLTYPLYFLDFETFRTPVPQYDGTKPYLQIPFQYSLHYIECEGGELKHKEFLAEPGTDPRRVIAEALCRDIPMNVSVLAYNMTFERDRIRALAERFPDLSEHLLNMCSPAHLKDLAVPFQKGWYFNSGMCTKGDSPSLFSVKNALPALFPNDPDLDYHSLEGVHNGGEAMTVFPAMEKMSPEEQAETRKNLLKYCELDTYAMVKVWQALKEAVK